jgi:peptide/nickel transport system substrate-binding protein
MEQTTQVSLSRRGALAGAAGLAGTLAAPGLSKAQRRDPRVLRFIPNTGLTVLDPVWTASLVTGNHAYHVFDTLYGTASDWQPAPQMAAGHTVEDEWRTWHIRLREDLWFHDGTPVRAQDCAASIKRWARRDSFGSAMMTVVDSIEAADDRTIRFRFRRRFPHLLEALARTSGLPCMMMPERFGVVDGYTALTEMVGSGPYRFVADEFNPGTRVVYRKFDRYVPRREPADRTAGGKVAHFERVEWHTMPDPSTAVAAMQSGEMDWWESTPADLRPLVQRARNLRLESKDPFGWMGILRFNMLQEPFNNVRLRRALLSAVNQADFMQAGAGEGAEAWRTCRAYFPCGAPNVTETAGTAAMPLPDDLAAAKRAIAAAGYNGEKIVLLVPTDIHHHAAFGQVSGDLLRRLEMNVDFQAMDWGTMIQRLTNRGPVEKNGWSLFHTAGSMVSMASPALNFFIGGTGEKGWTGWYDKPEIVALTQDWLDTPPEAPQQPIFDRIQRVLFDDPPFVPLGQYTTFASYGRDITGGLPGIGSYPWNIRRV